MHLTNDRSFDLRRPFRNELNMISSSICSGRAWFKILFVCLLFWACPTLAQANGPVSIEYTLETSGQVSAGMYDADGRLVRTLLRGSEQEAGQHSVRWDGLNRHGEPQPPGEYTFKLLRKPPFKKEFVTRIGVNPGSSRYHRWVGNHSGATSVAVDDSGMYIACSVTEGPPVLIKQSKDGTRRIWTRHRKDVSKGRYQGGLSLAADDNRVFMLQQNGYIQVINSENGQVVDTWDVLPDGKERKSDGGDTLFHY